MANKYFIAGVGRALLFKGETLFADCRTQADSSITIGVTAEDIRGGEGNKLWGQYFHDSTFSMKLTDIMFKLEYIAANCGSEIENGGDVFYTEELTASGTTLTLSQTPVPIISGGTAKVYARLASDGGADMEEYVASGNTITVPTANVAYCVMYRYNDDAAKQITVSAQFIPDTLHAVLTVALYLGDACDVTAATKAGEVEIDIPRFQLTGAMDISMTATGSAQTPLEGNALATGCEGCEGDGIYATITKVLFNSNWYDGVKTLIFDNASRSLTVGDVANELFTVYAVYASGSPKAIAASNFTWAISAGDTGLSISQEGVVTGTAAAGTATITATSKDDASLVATGTITVAASE